MCSKYWLQQVDYTAWASDEPNNYKSNEDCAGLWPAIAGDWNDYDCHDNHAYICKTNTGMFLELLHVKLNFFKSML